MKNILKSSWVIATLFLLAGCRNQINQDFAKRFAELQAHNHAEADVSLSDSMFTISEAEDPLQDYLTEYLGNLTYELVAQKDSQHPENIELTASLNLFGSRVPLLEGRLIGEHFLLDTSAYLGSLAVLPDMNQSSLSYDSFEYLKEDYRGTFLLLSDEWEADKSVFSDKDKQKQETDLRAFREAFLKISPENFSQTKEEISLLLEKEDMKKLADLFLETSNLAEEENTSADILSEMLDKMLAADGTAETILTLSKEEERMSISFSMMEDSVGEENSFGIETDIYFSDRQGKVETPPVEKIVTQARIQNLLTPLQKSDSQTGYTDPVFEKVLKRVEDQREKHEFTEDSAQRLLEAYFPLLTKEQYQKLEEILSIETLSQQFSEIPDWNSYPTAGPTEHSPTGYPKERFDALLESIETYRDSQTKESAQKTLDRYFGILNEEQYQELERVLDIDNLP